MVLSGTVRCCIKSESPRSAVMTDHSGSVVSMIGGAKGVIIPHQFVKAVGDVFLINKSALPSPDSNMEEIPEDLI